MRELEKKKEQELKRKEKGGFRKRYYRQERWSVSEMTVIEALKQKGISLRSLSSKNLRTDRQVSFQNTIKTLHSKIHNHTTSFVTCCSLNVNNIYIKDNFIATQTHCLLLLLFAYLVDALFVLKISFTTF